MSKLDMFGSLYSAYYTAQNTFKCVSMQRLVRERSYQHDT